MNKVVICEKKQLVVKDFEFPFKQLKIRKGKGGNEVWDCVRKKWVSLTPEEFVRQQAILFLIENKGFPLERMSVEKQILVNERKRRPDLVLYDRMFSVLLVAEFKSPEIPISQAVLDQAAIYHLDLNPMYILISNGVRTAICKKNESGKWLWLSSFPNLNEPSSLA